MNPDQTAPRSSLIWVNIASKVHERNREMAIVVISRKKVKVHSACFNEHVSLLG